MTQYCIPCNWDDQLIKFLSGPRYSLYGKLGLDPIGGGRPACKIPQPNRKFVEDYIKKARAKGMNFNYLLNSSCLGNREFTKTGYRSIIELLKWVQGTGANYVTVGTPYLAELIKAKFPDFKISLSKMAFVSSPQQAKFWQDLGVSEITLDPNINRNFKKLKQIKKTVKVDLILLVNEACLFHCPYVYYHVNSDSHASQSNDPGAYVCYSRLFCEKVFAANPEQIIKSMFIRPEDLPAYEKIGINKFKLVGRGRPTEWILNAAKAYINKKYEGNLAKILGTFSRYENLPVGKSGLLRLNDIGNLKNLERLRKTDLLRPQIYIDNRALDGFLRYFQKFDCESLDCEECGHCRIYAKKSVTIDKKEQKAVLGNLNKLTGWLKDGCFNS